MGFRDIGPRLPRVFALCHVRVVVAGWLTHAGTFAPGATTGKTAPRAMVSGRRLNPHEHSSAASAGGDERNGIENLSIGKDHMPGLNC